jgi:methionyl aminopeptidase
VEDPGEIDAVAAAAALREKAAPGVRPYDLDLLARDMIADAGAASSFVGYHPTWSPTPYPAVICSSVNDAVVHGYPGPHPAGARRPAQRRLRRPPGRPVGGRRAQRRR